MRLPVLLNYCALFTAAAAAYGQAQIDRKFEFEVASIHPSAPPSGHFPAPASAKGGPGTSDPAMFRCANCSLSVLVMKAFALEKYQFPAQSSLPPTTFDVAAKIPSGSTQEQFEQMLQNFLVDRFGLAYHFDTKSLQGYELVVAKNGPKLKETNGTGTPATAESTKNETANSWHGSGNSSQRHSRPGLIIFFGKAQYRGDAQTTTELAQVIANQLARPVEDKTGLTGKYDITLSWADDGSHAASHGPLSSSAGGGHSDTGDSHASSGIQADAAESQTLQGAIQTQLGLKLVDGKKTAAKIFVVDRIAKSPTGN